MEHETAVFISSRLYWCLTVLANGLLMIPQPITKVNTELKKRLFFGFTG